MICDPYLIDLAAFCHNLCSQIYVKNKKEFIAVKSLYWRVIYVFVFIGIISKVLYQDLLLNLQYLLNQLIFESYSA